MSDIDFIQLRQTLNRGYDFGMSEVSKNGLEMACDGDLPLALMKIREWQNKGLVIIIKNPLIASPDEICIKILNRIED